MAACGRWDLLKLIVSTCLSKCHDTLDPKYLEPLTIKYEKAPRNIFCRALVYGMMKKSDDAQFLIRETKILEDYADNLLNLIANLLGPLTLGGKGTGTKESYFITQNLTNSTSKDRQPSLFTKPAKGKYPLLKFEVAEFNNKHPIYASGVTLLEFLSSCMPQSDQAVKVFINLMEKIESFKMKLSTFSMIKLSLDQKSCEEYTKRYAQECEGISAGLANISSESLLDTQPHPMKRFN